MSNIKQQAKSVTDELNLIDSLGREVTFYSTKEQALCKAFNSHYAEAGITYPYSALLKNECGTLFYAFKFFSKNEEVSYVWSRVRDAKVFDDECQSTLKDYTYKDYKPTKPYVNTTILSIITTARNGRVINVLTLFPESEMEANRIGTKAVEAAIDDSDIFTYFTVETVPLKDVVPKNARVVVARAWDSCDESGFILLGNEDETNKMAAEIIIKNNDYDGHEGDPQWLNENADEQVVILKNHPLSDYL